MLIPWELATQSVDSTWLQDSYDIRECCFRADLLPMVSTLRASKNIVLENGLSSQSYYSRKSYVESVTRINMHQKVHLLSPIQNIIFLNLYPAEKRTLNGSWYYWKPIEKCIYQCINQESAQWTKCQWS